MLHSLASRLTKLMAAAAIALPAHGVLAQNLTTVRYQEYPGSIIHLSNWVMREKGMCAKHGLRCEAVQLASGPLAQQAAAAGSVDLIVSSADVMMQAVSKGNDLQILGAMITNNVYSLSASTKLARPNAKAGYPVAMKDLVGKRFGVSARGSATEMYVRTLLEASGHSANEAIYIAVGAPPTAFAALTAGQVDAILSWDPVPALCKATGNCEVVVDLRKGEGPAQIGEMNGGFVVWQARRSYVEKNAKTIDAFLAAHADAVAWLRDQKNFPEAMTLAAATFKLGDVPNREQALEQIVRESISQYGTTFNRKVVNGFNNFLVSNKLIEKPLDAQSLVYKNAP